MCRMLPTASMRSGFPIAKTRRPVGGRIAGIVLLRDCSKVVSYSACCASCNVSNADYRSAWAPEVAGQRVKCGQWQHPISNQLCVKACVSKCDAVRAIG
jgi:hypothetical protein